MRYGRTVSRDTYTQRGTTTQYGPGRGDSSSLKIHAVGTTAHYHTRRTASEATSRQHRNTAQHVQYSPIKLTGLSKDSAAPHLSTYKIGGELPCAAYMDSTAPRFSAYGTCLTTNRATHVRYCTVAQHLLKGPLHCIHKQRCAPAQRVQRMPYS